MNIINIIVKEIKENLRDIRAIGLMVLFPIVLMLVLGTALSGVFDNSSQFKNINIVYTQQETPVTTSSLNSTFKTFLTKGEEMGFEFTKVDSVQAGMDGVQQGKYVCFINVRDNGMELIKNEQSAFKANLVESILGSFLQRYNALVSVAEVNPTMLSKITAPEEATGYVTLSSLGERRQPRAMDYYAITMLTLITLYSTMTGAGAIKGERNLKTLNRLLCSPVHKYEILTGKIFGTLAITVLQVLAVIGFSKFVLKTYWGNHMGMVLLLVMSEVIMAVSLGLGVAFLTQNDKVILNLLVPIMGFLGGGYVPIEDSGELLLKLANFSPLRWVNQSIFQVVFSDDFSKVIPTILINLAAAAVFLLISTVYFRKEAV